MIAATVEELTPLIGTRPACRALGASPATIYRRRRPPEPRPPEPRPTPERALSEAERGRVLEVLHSERFVDISPEETWATLLDEGTYLCSTRTMYRILAAHHGGVRERRDQLTHPAYAKPELLAERPNELWSWDVSKLKGPAKWTYYYLYVILDVFSRYVVGWAVQYRENGQLAKALIEQATEQQKITPKVLTLHADRGAPQRAKPVAFLLADLGVTKTHSRPYTSSDNPYSESNFKTLKYRPEFPERFDDIEHARAHCRQFFRWYNHEHRHSGIGLMTPAAFHHGQAPALHAARGHVLDAAYARQPRAVRPQPTRPAGATDSRVDQQAKGGHRRSLISNARRLTGLDRLRLAAHGQAANTGRGRSGRPSCLLTASMSATCERSARLAVCAPFPGEHQRRRRRGSLVLRTRSTILARLPLPRGAEGTAGRNPRSGPRAQPRPSPGRVLPCADRRGARRCFGA